MEEKLVINVIRITSILYPSAINVCVNLVPFGTKLLKLVYHVKLKFHFVLCVSLLIIQMLNVIFVMILQIEKQTIQQINAFAINFISKILLNYVKLATVTKDAQAALIHKTVHYVIQLSIGMLNLLEENASVKILMFKYKINVNYVS